MAEVQSNPREPTHLNIWDRVEREAFAARMGVSEDKLRKAVQMVGSRITTLSSYLKI
ncbi:DUF3606 domain-containing protein [Methylobacterium dankookense]|jgi:hypothetical protein|uniref:DUF3606 domain-containing protein n=1 Tax=Methylobacterium dankookense TaxID=560405 RepID=A0A564G0L7_9HYPH|nr:DUF3606 domain-containing protein [Methylobacterium dankookense]GJD57683.1 hypothetical protein IFDJLNFL_3595 [Methylobacterium dankookense]VUF13777.1 hypothetical protein MTDSW087_03484 [Methylobacterium dankookense]